MENSLKRSENRARETASSTPREQQIAQRPSFELTTHTFKGPNVNVRYAAVRCEILIGSPGLFDPDAWKALIQRLLRLVPELDTELAPQLNEHNWNNEEPVRRAMVAEICAVTTYMLMRRIDETIAPVSSGLLESEPGFYLICEYKRSPGNAKAAVKMALELLASTDGEKKLKQALAEFERNGKRHTKIPFHAANIMAAAEVRGIPASRTVTGPPILGWGKLQSRLRQTMTNRTGYMAVKMARDKVRTAEVLKQAGLPVPEQYVVEHVDDAVAAAKRIGYPVVVKPAVGNMGRGVSVKLTSEAAVAGAFREAAAINKSVIVESYIAGSSYRLLVVDGELVAASQYIAGHVVGNGRDTVRRLLEMLNADPLRDDHFLYKIKLDFDALRMLEEQDLTLDSIPANGAMVFLRSNSNPNVGALTVGLTERVHPDNRLLAIAATRAIGLDVAGIDMITEDISRSYKEAKGAICEVNNMPGLGAHATPTSGTVVEVAPYILDMLFPPPSRGRIPVVAIYGDSFNDRLSHRIAHLLQIAGHETGLAAQDGLWIGGDRISTSNSADFDGARRVLLNQAVTAAVIEVSTGAMLDEGLGFDIADVAIVGNGFPSLAGDDRQHRNVAALISSSAGSLLLGEDTPYARDLLAAMDESKVKLVHHPAVSRGSCEGDRLAAAACHAIGIPIDVIEDALKASFDPHRSGPFLISSLNTRFGRILMATPRTGQDVETLSRLAASWAAPQLPDIIIHMTFEGEPDFRSALDAQLHKGAARVLLPRGVGYTEADLPALVFTGGDRKVLILTDNMEFFRKRLGQSASRQFAPVSSIGRS